MVISACISTSRLPLTQQGFNCQDRIPPRTDVLWRIESGAVRTFTWSEEGTVITLGYWGAGDVVGQRLSQLKPYVIECLTDVEVSILPPALWQEAVDAIILHIQNTESLLSIVNQNPLQQHLWQFLVFLGQKFGRDVEQGRLIDLPLTHQELAEGVWSKLVG